MEFYQEIAKYYEHIFPKGDQQVAFLKKYLERPSKTILDVACGNGAYAIELAKAGYQVTAIDHTKEMVQSAIEKAEFEDVIIEAKACNMRALTKQLKGPYGGIFCIGNSLVHLDELIEVEDALMQMRELLEQEGVLVLQIMNYDRILNNNITALPLIENEQNDLKFIRNYELDTKANRILFHTNLKVKNTELTHTTKLLPITSETLCALLEKVGFKITHLFGNFTQEAYEKETSYHTIIVAKKE